MNKKKITWANTNYDRAWGGTYSKPLILDGVEQKDAEIIRYEGEKDWHGHCPICHEHISIFPGKLPVVKKAYSEHYLACLAKQQ